MIDLLRCVLRLPPRTIERIDQIADAARVALVCEVPRSAVMRAALTAWLDLVEDVNQEHVIEAIRVAIVKRGRKPQ